MVGEFKPDEGFDKRNDDDFAPVVTLRVASSKNCGDRSRSTLCPSRGFTAMRLNAMSKLYPSRNVIKGFGMEPLIHNI
jgi:hypothetical protein